MWWSTSSWWPSPGSTPPIKAAKGLLLMRFFPVVLLGVSGWAWPHATTPNPEYRYIVRNYGPEAGFSQNAVNALLQGRDGYLWLGTFGGLVRFDGNRFTTLRAGRHAPSLQDPMDRGGPSSDRVEVLREDARGRLWIGTEDGGISLYDHGRFQHLPVCGATCRVRAISQQVGSTIWAVTNAGVFRIAVDTLQATLIRDRVPGFLYSEVAIGNDGRVYVGGQGKHLGVVLGDDIVPVSGPQGIVSTWQVRRVGRDIWIKGDEELYRFEPAQQAWSVQSVEPDMRLLSSPDGSVWERTAQGALLRTDRSGVPHSFPGLPRMQVNAVWRDNAGVLWVGSGDKGLWSVERSKAVLIDYPSATGFHAGRAVVGDGKGGTWLGYATGGVRHRLSDGSYEQLPAEIANEREYIVSLLRDSGSDLWLGGVGNGLLRISGGSAQTIPSSKHNNLQVWQADNGERWLAAEGHTFRILSRDDGTFALSEPIGALEGNTIRKMATARKGGVWFAGDQGVVRLDRGQIAERWTPEQGLSSRFARSVYEDQRGVLWIGTYGGGLNRIENGIVARYDESNGLFDDTVSCILADRTGHMWLAGNRGISVLPKASQTGVKVEALPFAVSAGSESFEFNGGTQSACYQDEDGRLWFALVRGFAKVDPAMLAEVSPHQPQVHIEEVVSGGAKRDPGGTVFLGASAESLEIEYTATNLSSPDQLVFRYRMSGPGQKWNDAGPVRHIIFQDVPWGDHVFEVQARNRGGAWSPSATLRISRPIPWYQRQWLWPLGALLALLALIWRTRNRDVVSLSGIAKRRAGDREARL